MRALRRVRRGAISESDWRIAGYHPVQMAASVFHIGAGRFFIDSSPPFSSTLPPPRDTSYTEHDNQYPLETTLHKQEIHQWGEFARNTGY
jgi:hypothetical protein